MKHHEIFISYRREGGEHLAGRVKDALKIRGFSVFLDVEDLKSGKFNEALLDKIEYATDFIVILTPGCLDRCKNEDDWLRKEIRHAIKCRCNIVPVLARGFQMPLPQALPSDIEELPWYNGLTPAHELFEASMDRLVSTFLKTGKLQAGASFSAHTQDSTTAETESHRFALLFEERPDVIAEIEFEASHTPEQLEAEFEKLLVRLEVQVCEPPPPHWRRPEDNNRRDRLLTLVEQYDASLEEARYFVAVTHRCILKYNEWLRRVDDKGSEEDKKRIKSMYSMKEHYHESGYDEWRTSLERYQRAIGNKEHLRNAIEMLGTPVVPLVCLSYRRYDTCDEINCIWRVQVHLAKIMSRLQDLRALPFLAKSLLRHEDDLNGHNSWCLGIIKAVRAFGVDRQIVDTCFERLVGVTASEILREKRDRERH